MKPIFQNSMLRLHTAVVSWRCKELLWPAWRGIDSAGLTGHIVLRETIYLELAGTMIIWVFPKIGVGPPNHPF